MHRPPSSAGAQPGRRAVPASLASLPVLAGGAQATFATTEMDRRRASVQLSGARVE